MDIIQNTGNVIIYNVIPTVIVLGIMIFFHELGHFLVAKLFNVKVLKFALGFGPKIVAREVGETEYSIRYLPLGGFVKILGEDVMDDESPEMAPEDEARAFNNQHPVKRIAIVAAGPVFNIILAIILYFGLFLFTGSYVTTPEIGYVTEDEAAQKAGIIEGDIIVSIGESNIKKWTDIAPHIKGKAGIPVAVTVNRDDEIFTFSVIPEEKVLKNIFGEEVVRTRIGILPAIEVMSPVGAFRDSLSESWTIIKLTYYVVVKLFKREIPMNTVGGPILIGQMTGKIVKEDVGRIIPLMGIISINLGILNLLPIPILDGGVILFLLFELIRGKPLGLDKREFAQKVGISILLLLMVVVFYNDFLRIFTE